jgi:putative DNA primase/helicase
MDDCRLKPPQVVLTATAEYLESEDALTSWMDDRCERTTQSWASSTDLFISWKNWADAAGEPSGTQKRFSQKLEERGFDKERNRDGRGFRGLRVVTSLYGSN